MDDVLLKKLALEEMRKKAARDVIEKGIDPYSKEAGEYAGLDFLSKASEDTRKKLEELPEDEKIDRTYKMLIPYRVPSIETITSKKKSLDEPSLTEEFKGETITDLNKKFADRLKTTDSNKIEDVLMASEERIKPKFNQLKDSLGPQRKIASVSEEQEKTPDYFNDYQGVSIPKTTFFNLPPNVQVQLNKTHRYNKEKDAMEPK
jgi:hypothetical protein